MAFAPFLYLQMCLDTFSICFLLMSLSISVMQTIVCSLSLFLTLGAFFTLSYSDIHNQSPSPYVFHSLSVAISITLSAFNFSLSLAMSIQSIITILFLYLYLSLGVHSLLRVSFSLLSFSSLSFTISLAFSLFLFTVFIL